MRRGGGDGRIERKISTGLLGSNKIQEKGRGVGSDLDRSSVDKMDVYVFVLHLEYDGVSVEGRGVVTR